MSEHTWARETLPLAAAGVLDGAERRRLEEHTAVCEACRREMERWTALARGLRDLPAPPPPEALAERTRRRVLGAATRMEQPRDIATAVALAMFAWTVGLAGWAVMHLAAGSLIGEGGSRFAQTFTWLTVSTVAGWMTAGAAALLLGRRRDAWRSL